MLFTRGSPRTHGRRAVLVGVADLHVNRRTYLLAHYHSHYAARSHAHPCACVGGTSETRTPPPPTHPPAHHKQRRVAARRPTAQQHSHVLIGHAQDLRTPYTQPGTRP